MPQDIRTRIGIALVSFLAVIAIIAGVAAKKAQGPPPIVITEPSGPSDPSIGTAPTVASATSLSASPPANTAQIYVHVAGAVKKPDLYQLPANTRLFQALKAAGGAKAGADLDAVDLAEKLSDGEKVYVPTRDEVNSETVVAFANAGNDIGEHAVLPNAAYSTRVGKAPSRSKSGSGSNKLTDPSQGMVDINTASAEELQRLPGVGPAMAARILAFRQSAGRFRKVDDLMEISGVGPKKFAKMSPYVKL